MASAGASKEKILHRQSQRYQFFTNLKKVSFDCSQLKETAFLEESTLLWTAFIKSMDTPSQCAEHLKSFLQKFNPSYNTWNNEFHLDELWSQQSIEKSFGVPLLTPRESPRVIQMFETCIIKTTNAIRSQKPVEKLLSVEILYMMNLLSRAIDNHRFLRISCIIEHCLGLLKACTHSVPSMFSVDISVSCNDSSKVSMQLTVAYSIQIITNLMSFLGYWSTQGIIAEDEQFVIQTKNEMHKNEFLLITTDLLKLLKKTAQTNNYLKGSQYDFHIMVLNSVGCFLYNYPYGKKNLPAVSLLDQIVKLLGWPQNIFDLSEEAIPDEILLLLRREYHVQTIAMRILLEAITGYPRNTQRVCELGGWAFLIDVILWVTRVYSIHPVLEEEQKQKGSDLSLRKGEETEGKGLSRVSELKEIFDLLYFLCVGSLKYSGRRTRTGSSIESELNKEVKISQHLNRHILSVVIDLFNKDIRNCAAASFVRAQLVRTHPELQTHVLEFMVSILQRYKPAILLCTKDHLWDLLFSEHFYYCGYEEGVFSGLEMKQDVKQKSLHQQKFFEKVHQQVLLFIKFTGALSGHNNIHECVKLVNLLDCYYYDPRMITTVSSILEMFLQQNTEVTQQALSRIRALSILFDVIKRQHDLYESMKQMTEEELEVFGFSLHSFMNSRLTSVSLLCTFLHNNEEAKTLLIQNESMIETLLNLLFEPQLRESCLRVTMSAMSPYRDSEKNRALATLYSHYFKIFRHTQDRTGDEDFNLLLMLLSGIRSLVQKYPKSRNLWRESGAFLNITTALNTEERLDRLPELCIEVFKTLLSLVAHSEKNKKHMQKDIGYDTLINLVLRALQSDPELKLLHNLMPLLFDLLVDGKFDLETRYVIQNADIVTFMFRLVLHIPDKQRNNMLDTFTALVNKCPLNQSLCCEKQLIFCLLDMIPKVNQNAELLQRFSSLIEVLGTHSITVKELKRQFLLLKSETGDFRPRGQIRLMKALQFMALSRTIGPLTFFDFNGKTSLLEIPVLEKWPRSSGYTFCLWIRAETLPPQPTSSGKAVILEQPRVFSFLDQEGFGLELYLTSDSSKISSNYYFLEVSLANTTGKTSTCRFVTQSFELQRWYFITLTHANQNKLRLKEAELSFFVNGAFKERAAVRYPQFPQVLNRACIGSNFAVSGSGRRLQQSHYFHGQLGPFLLFDESVSPSQAKFLFTQTNELLRSGTSCFGELESRIVLYYNSTARVGKTFLDLTPEKIRDRRFDAHMKGRIYSCASPDVKDTIHCLGGIQVLFPIFAQLDQPEVPESLNDTIDYTIDSRLLLQGLALLGDMLFMSETNQQEMLRCQGFEVIGFLLEQSSPQHLTSEAVVTLEDLAHKIQGSRALEDTFWQCIICRWSIWLYTDAKVQWELLKLLHQTVQTNVATFRRSVGVQRLLDALYFYYWYTERKGVYCTKEFILHSVTREVIGKRPSQQELHSLRKFFFSSMTSMLAPGSTEQEIRPIVAAILDTKDPVALAEMLDFVISLLKARTPNVASQFLLVGDIHLFVMLLQSESDEVITRALLIIHMLIQEKVEGHIGADYYQIANVLTHFNLSIYHVLYNLLVGVISLEASVIDEEHEVHEARLLPVLWKLVPLGDDFLKQKVVQDIYILCTRSDKNCDAILQSNRWVNYLLDILAFESKLEETESSKIVKELCYNLFKILVIYTDRSEHFSQHKMLYQIVLISSYYESRGIFSQESFLRNLYSRLLKAWRNDSSSALSPRGNKSDADYHLVSHIKFIGLLDQFFFYTPPPERIKTLQSKKRRNLSLSISSPAREVEASLVEGSTDSVTYSPVRGVSAMTLHITSGTWDDLDLALLLFDTLHREKFFTSMHSSRVKNISKQAEKVHDIRTSLFMILLRIAVNIVRHGSIDACLEIIPILRDILRADLNKKPNARTNYALSHILVTVKMIGLGDDAESIAKCKVILPFAKELVLFSLPALPPAALSARSLFSPRRSYREFLEDYKHAGWTAVFNWAVQICASNGNDERAYCSTLDKMYTKAIQPIVQSIQQTELSRKKASARTKEFFEYFQANLLPKEVERKENLRRYCDELQALTRRAWRNILRSLTNERGPWASNEEGKIYWKLDKTENFSRMRLKLKRNYHFDSHADAVKDDGAAPIDLEEDATQTQEETLRLFSGMKLSAVGEEAGVDDETLLLPPEPEPESLLPAVPQEERHVYSSPCELITPLTVTPGTLEITTFKLYFREDSSASKSADQNKMDKELRIPLEQVKGIHLRRYLLRQSALEFFKTDRRNYFLNFPKKEHSRVYNKIASLRPPNLTYLESGTPAAVLRKSGLTKKWQQGLISNFDYLMQLNTIAGRSFNDITQYPVFPWVLNDYTSPTIDLSDPKVYRDLAWPVGALNPSKREGLQVRYEAFNDPNIPKFHHGSHYSSSGIVLFYLIRLEPFTTHFLTLQGGKFDHGDRMFHSLPTCYQNLLTGSSDVKELIPEFFCFPEFLRNSSKFNLGKKQDGTILDDVILPPWASSPEEFVRINREALESDYVSEHLHDWIDLIFGYKQRGKPAEASLNVFYYLTYEGAVNLDEIKDEAQRRATESQIDNFGQTPSQLLRKPHPKRLNLTKSSYFERIHSLASTFGPLSRSRKHLGALRSSFTYQSSLYPVSAHHDPIAFVCDLTFFFSTSPVRDHELGSNNIVTVTETRFVQTFKLTDSPNAALNFPFTLAEADPSVLGNRKCGGPFAPDLPISSHLFACSKDGTMILSCGHWDSSIKCSWVNQSRPMQSLSRHKDVVTCLALASDGKTFVTGSKDTTVLVWHIVYSKGAAYRVEETPQHILYGHNDEVTCIAVDVGLDVCVSGSRDGTCIIHNLQSGRYLRSLYHPQEKAISLVAVSTLGHVVFYSSDDLKLFVYNVNGRFLTSSDVPERLEQIFIPHSATFVVTSGHDGTLSFREIHSLKLVQRICVPCRVRSLTLSSDESYIIGGLQDGHVLFLALEEINQ